MPLHQRTATLTLAGAGQVVLVLDASQSAEPLQNQIAWLAGQLLSQLPGGSCPRLYFLGNSEPYAASQLGARAASWFEENRPRASLMTPVLEAPDLDRGATIVVIGSGTVFDLEDWADTPLSEHLLMVSVGESLQAQARRVREVGNPDPAQLVEMVHDPVVKVTVSGEGFMPTWWDNPGYKLQLSDGQAVLVGSRLDRFDVTLRYPGRGRDLPASDCRPGQRPTDDRVIDCGHTRHAALRHR